jgi:hypothetical protein
MHERESLHARLHISSAAPVAVPLPALTPEPIPVPAFVALECDIEPIVPAVAVVGLLVAAEHNKRLLVVDVPGIDWSWVSTWMAEYWRVPLALAVAFFLIVVSW